MPQRVVALRTTNTQFLPNLHPEDLLVIASQSCDLCCPSHEEEPNFEIIVARSLSAEFEDSNRSYGKHPRRLQFYLTRGGDGERLYEANINERYSIPRRLLAESNECADECLSDSQLSTFRRWLGRRYFRAALPTEFNERAKPAQSHLTKKLKSAGKLITGIYLQLDPNRELVPEEKYRLYVHLTVLPETAATPNLLAQALSAQVVVQSGFARCKGIELLGAQVISESEFSLNDIRQCLRWDYSDYISYRDETPEGLAPDG